MKADGVAVTIQCPLESCSMDIRVSADSVQHRDYREVHGHLWSEHYAELGGTYTEGIRNDSYHRSLAPVQYYEKAAGEIERITE